LRVTRSLELLAGLKQAVAGFAKREEQIARHLSRRRHAAGHTGEAELEAAQANYAAQVAETEKVFGAEVERIKARYEKRRARIQKYRTATLRNLPARAQEAKGKWLAELQMRNYRAQRKLKADLEANDAAFPGFLEGLEEHKKAFIHLSRRVRKSFGAYWTLGSMLKRGVQPAESNLPPAEQLRAHFLTAEAELAHFQRFPIPRFFRYAPLPLWFFLIVGVDAGLFFGLKLELDIITYIGAGISVVVFGVIWAIHHIGLTQSKPTATNLAHAVVQARQIIANSNSDAATAQQHETERQRIQAEYEQTTAQIQEQWALSGNIESEFEYRVRSKVDRQTPRIEEKIDASLQRRLPYLESEKLGWLERFKGELAAIEQQVAAARQAEVGTLGAEEQAQWDRIEADWKREIFPLYQTVETINAEINPKFPAWDIALVKAWTPSTEFSPAAKFGHLDLDLARNPAEMPKDPRLTLPGPAQVSLPLALSFPYQGSLLFETKESGGPKVLDTLNNIVLRLLSNTPPGKLNFTIIDPVGLGQSFAGLMFLADYQEMLINRRIWTQRDQIEERMAELSEHIEKVIQMYLRNEYATITEYNEKAGSVAEKYHFLVVSDFPANFSDLAAKRLTSIAASGARCGIYTLIHWDQRQPLPDGFVPDELRKNSVCLYRSGSGFTLGNQQAEIGAALAFDPPPNPDLAVELVHKIGKASIDSNRVQVPFSQIAPQSEAEMWTNDTTNELRIAVGRTGATKHQFLAIGKGTKQHALFAGKTGSGKSTLFHVIITNLALACSPDQVEFYLIDFKKGVEFKCYATKHLPHAKVVAIESDREFALSVLHRVDAELKRRGDMFRKLGAQDLAGYKRAGGTEPMPRSLLLIDEFQEFFVQDDAVAQGASLLFDRIVRQGRAFGIHVLLGSQTLGGAYSLARATLGQMAIRVALQCNEADAHLIMDENNSAPRLLTRPGEGIYNDAAGAIEGNSPFQVVWLPDEERDLWLDKINALVAKSGRNYSSPIVFEGNAPADIRENELLRTALETAPTTAPPLARAWLGAPNSIKGPTEATFARQSGQHMLIVGQREEASVMMLGISMLALAAQYPKGTAKFVLFQSTIPGTAEADLLDQIVKAIPHEVVVAHGQEISGAMNDLSAELKTRSGGEIAVYEAPAVFVFVHGLQKFKKLKHEDDFSFSSGGDEGGADPGAQFNKLITEGSGYGIHLIVAVDTLNSVNRFMNRKALTEFEMRVLFQMSANDSASLIDSPKASELGLHRAIFYNEHEGSTETFRPYALPDAEWLGHVAEELGKRR
jgi:Holliday junction resolvasome RuvABC endonuclease subunit